MNKRRLIIRVVAICFLFLFIVGIIAYHDYYLQRQEDINYPNGMGSYYGDKGYFKIDPKTILASLKSGDMNVFTPILAYGAYGFEEIPNLSIYWTLGDFLNIASTLGQLVWDDTMDLKDWNVYSVLLEGRCGDPIGFYSANITYFKTGKDYYTARLIEIEPYFGWARWGGGISYPKPILRKWKGVDLPGAKISADEALRMVNEEVKAHFKITDDNCEVIIDSSRFNPKRWQVDIWLGSTDNLIYTVNLETGEMTRRR